MYISGGCVPLRCVVMHIAVKLVPMHVPLQTLSSTVMQSHNTGRVQTSDRVLHTCCISLFAVGPRAPTTTLSRNCANDKVLPRGVDHSGCPRGEKERFPSLRIRGQPVSWLPILSASLHSVRWEGRPLGWLLCATKFDPMLACMCL